MRALFILAVVVDIGLAVLLIAGSGFVLQGVNNTATFDSSAAFILAAIAVCLLAPVVAIVLHRQGRANAALVAALLPVVGALLALTIPPPY